MSSETIYISSYSFFSIVISGPLLYRKLWVNKQHEKYLDSPESIFLANKKNFEIAYDYIGRVEIHPETRLPRRYPKINVVIDTKEYKFNTIKKATVEYYMDLLLPILPGKMRYIGDAPT
jgi:hypothetical protein